MAIVGGLVFVHQERNIAHFKISLLWSPLLSRLQRWQVLLAPSLLENFIKFLHVRPPFGWMCFKRLKCTCRQWGKWYWQILSPFSCIDSFLNFLVGFTSLLDHHLTTIGFKSLNLQKNSLREKKNKYGMKVFKKMCLLYPQGLRCLVQDDSSVNHSFVSNTVSWSTVVVCVSL